MITNKEILEWATEEQFLLFCEEDDILQIVREALRRFGNNDRDTVMKIKEKNNE